MPAAAGVARLRCITNKEGRTDGGEYRVICTARQIQRGAKKGMWQVREPKYLYRDGSGRHIPGRKHIIDRQLIKTMPGIIVTDVPDDFSFI